MLSCARLACAAQVAVDFVHALLHPVAATPSLPSAWTGEVDKVQRDVSGVPLSVIRAAADAAPMPGTGMPPPAMPPPHAGEAPPACPPTEEDMESCLV